MYNYCIPYIGQPPPPPPPLGGYYVDSLTALFFWWTHTHTHPQCSYSQSPNYQLLYEVNHAHPPTSIDHAQIAVGALCPLWSTTVL